MTKRTYSYRKQNIFLKEVQYSVFSKLLDCIDHQEKY